MVVRNIKRDAACGMHSKCTIKVSCDTIISAHYCNNILSHCHSPDPWKFRGDAVSYPSPQASFLSGEISQDSSSYPSSHRTLSLLNILHVYPLLPFLPIHLHTSPDKT